MSSSKNNLDQSPSPTFHFNNNSAARCRSQQKSLRLILPLCLGGLSCTFFARSPTRQPRADSLAPIIVKLRDHSRDWSRFGENRSAEEDSVSAGLGLGAVVATPSHLQAKGCKWGECLGCRGPCFQWRFLTNLPAADSKGRYRGSGLDFGVSRQEGGRRKNQEGERFLSFKDASFKVAPHPTPSLYNGTSMGEAKDGSGCLQFQSPVNIGCGGGELTESSRLLVSARGFQTSPLGRILACIHGRILVTEHATSTEARGSWRRGGLVAV
jgi:hypothetical protein